MIENACNRNIMEQPSSYFPYTFLGPLGTFPVQEVLPLLTQLQLAVEVLSPDPPTHRNPLCFT